MNRIANDLLPGLSNTQNTG